MKRLSSLVLALLIAALGAVPAFAENAAAVVDLADIFTDEEESQITQLIQENIADKHDYSMIIFTDTQCGSDYQSYAEAEYVGQVMDGGCNPEGSILFICMDPSNRFWYSEGISVEDDGIPYTLFTDPDNINVIDDAIYPYMASGDYFTAMKDYIDYVDVLYTDGAFYYDSPSDFHGSSGYYYPDYEDEYYTSASSRAGEFLMAGVFALVAGIAVGLAVRGSAVNKMKTVKLAKTADLYKVPGQCSFPMQQDILLHRSVAVTRIEDDNNHGGGGGMVGHSGGSFMSGGHSFGGGGGSFHGGGGGRSF